MLSINVRCLAGNVIMNVIIERLAMSKCSSEDDCSLKLILILKLILKFWLYAVLLYFNVIGLIVVLEILVLVNMITLTPYCFLVGNGIMRCQNRSPATRVPAIRDDGNTGKSGDTG